MAARRAVEYIEIDVDWCDLVFGVHPCRASLANVFDPDSDYIYEFNDGTSGLYGWGPAQISGGPVTFVGGASYATFAMNGATTGYISKSFASEPIIGGSFDAIRLNMRRTAAHTTFNGFADFVTASGYFRVPFTSNPALNTDVTQVLLMSTATPQGGESGSIEGKNITNINILLDNTGTGQIRFYSIELGTVSAGEDRCFNTRATCQDVRRYDPSPVTLRFAKDNGALSKDIYAQAIIKDISFSPATISVGKDLGIRATLSVTFQDRPHSDTGPGFDKYHALRSYNPFEQGTLWGKLRARQPYMLNNVVRHIRGFSDQALSEMQSRTFILTNLEQSGASGETVLEAQDVLRLTDRTRAQCPVQNNGFILNDIGAGATNLTLSPTGIGVEYGVEGYANLGGKEIVRYTRDVYARLTGDSELLLTFNEADGSTTFTDSSGKGRNASATGNAQVDTADKKYGVGSLLLDGSGDYLSVSDNNAWTFSGSFTLEAWVKPTSVTGNQAILSHSNGNTNSEWAFYINNGNLTFRIATGGSLILQFVSTGVVVTNEWQHVAIVRDGTTYTFYINGVPAGTTSGSYTIGNYTSGLRVGVRGDSTTGYFTGWIDTLHIASRAIWTADFSANLPRPPQASDNTLELIRAQLSTTAQAHSAQDRVQQVVYYEGMDPADVVYDLLVTYADTPTAWLDLDAMKNETGSFLQVNATGIIAEPTAVDKLLSELCEQFTMSIWWDDLSDIMRLRVMRGISADLVFSDQNTVNGTLTIEPQPDKRVSQVWIYYGKINPVESQEKAENYRSVAVTVDLEAESLHGAPAIVKIYSRWIPAGGRSIAQRIGEIILGRYVNAPRMFTFQLMNRDPEANNIELGSGIDVMSNFLQLPNGAPDSVRAQVIRYDPDVSRQRVEAEEYVFSVSSSFTERTIIIETDTYNVNLRALFDSLYPSPVAATVLDVIIESGATVGSTSTAVPAFDVGSWPAGATINLRVDGRIQGKGGQGGDGSSTNGTLRNGKPGGVALYTRFPIDMTGTGEIFGGGGGGGGGGYDFEFGGRGGGGAGTDGGLAGGGRGANNPGTADAGGQGGNGGTSSGDGGDGGGPGLSGSNGQPSGSVNGGSGNSAGAAIDGDSYITDTSTIDVRTSRIN